MSTSGYRLDYIRKVMVNGLKCYERKLLVSKLPETDKRFCPLHLPKAFRAGARRDKKMLAKTNWFKGKKGVDDVASKEKEQTAQNQGQTSKKERRKTPGSEGRVSPPPPGVVSPRSGPSTVMFVPWTAHGLLAGKLKAAEDRLAALTGFWVKYAEAGGVPLWRQFSTKLGDDQGCGREACVTCSQEDAVKVNCFARGIVYESACELCHPGERKEKEGEGMVSVWVPGLTQAESFQIERVQKCALHVILGDDYGSYNNAVSVLEVDKLSVRRSNLCLNFARRSEKNPKYQNWFCPAEEVIQPTMKTRSDKEIMPTRWVALMIQLEQQQHGEFVVVNSLHMFYFITHF